MIPKKYILPFTIMIALCTVLSYSGYMLYPENTFLQTARVLFGSMFVLFLPGYWCTLSFFTPDEIDSLERLALSFALSISIVPLLSFYLNLIGVPIQFQSIFMIVVGIIACNMSYLVYKYQYAK